MNIILIAFLALTTLQVVDQKITVDGREASVYGIVQPDGTHGLVANKGDTFDVALVNKINVPTSVHWHGLILPNDQDGVAFVTQLPIYPQTTYSYRFPILQAGTFFMHSHYGLQEQRLLTAPMIFHDAEDQKLADQEVVLLLSDFSFTSAEEIYRKLKCNCSAEMKDMKMGPDVVEVNYDAFLTNLKTLENPETIQVTSGKTVRLRVINGSSATNFLLDLGELEGQAIAVDGSRTEPLSGSHFELAVAQRIDILVKIPEAGGAFPVLARGEGTSMQTGALLTTGPSLKLSSKLEKKAGILTNEQESFLRALQPLASRTPNRKILVELGGDMKTYTWTLNGQSWPYVTPLEVAFGDRVEVTFKNVSSMAHPMHLHGHVFQVTAIDGKPLNGAMRDTVLVMPQSSLTIQFDATNRGVWPFHCHLLYHLEAGMFTVIRYLD